MWIPACETRVLCLRLDKFTQTTESCGQAQPLSQEEAVWTVALTGFTAFLGTLH